MITFGRKINFIPLSISIIFSLIIFFILDMTLTLASPLFTPCATAGGIIVFLLMTLAYYPTQLPYLCDYYEIDKDHIRFYNFNNYWQKVTFVFMGTKSPMSMIKTSAIKKAEIYGDDKILQMPAVATDLWITWIFINKVSIIKNPYGIKLTLDDGNTIKISATWNKIRDPKRTVAQVNKALELINQNIVK